MAALSLRNRNMSETDDTAKLILVAGSSFSFENKMQKEVVLTSISTTVTGDPGARLFGEIIEWKTLPVNPLPVQVSDVREWEKKIGQLNAIETVSGMLNELTAEQMEVFEQSVKRRAFFK